MTEPHAGPRVVVAWSPPDPSDDPVRFLDARERERYGALRRVEDRARLATGRALLRSVAAALGGGTPEAVELDTTCADCGAAHGRPRVPGAHLSLAHTQNRLVVAWSAATPVGVDVESTEASVEPALWPHVAAPGEPTSDFLGTWVRKEAVLKCRGTGLAVPMTAVVLARCAESVVPLDVGAGYVAALATAERPADVAVHALGRWSQASLLR